MHGNLPALIDHLAAEDGGGDFDLQDFFVATGQVVAVEDGHVGQHTGHQDALQVLFAGQPGWASGVGAQRFHAADGFLRCNHRALVGFARYQAVQADERIVVERAGDVARGDHRDATLEVRLGRFVLVGQLFADVAEQIVAFEVDERRLDDGADFVLRHGVE